MGYIGIMEMRMETTTMGVGLRILGGYIGIRKKKWKLLQWV